MGATIYNSDATRALIAGAGIQTSSDRVPSELADKTLPMIDQTPDFHRVIGFSSTNSTGNTGALTIHTASAVKDTYITNLSFSIVKSAACDIATGDLTITGLIDGKGTSSALGTIGVLTTTLERDTIQIVFPVPLKMARSGTIALSSVTFSLGALQRSATATGYEVNPPII